MPTAGPRYEVRYDGGLETQCCLDCGCRIDDEPAHTRFHSILSGHAWALAILQNAHIGQEVHDRFDVRERINRKRFDNWSAEALAEVLQESELVEQDKKTPSSEEEVLHGVNRVLTNLGFDETAVTDLINALHNEGVVFRWAAYLAEKNRTEGLWKEDDYLPVIYLSIGNSDDRLTQREWSDFIKTIDERVASIATTVHGRWFSDPADPWQNACWALEFRSLGRLMAAQEQVTEIRTRYRQDSAAWAFVAETKFI